LPLLRGHVSLPQPPRVCTRGFRCSNRSSRHFHEAGNISTQVVRPLPFIGPRLEFASRSVLKRVDSSAGAVSSRQTLQLSTQNAACESWCVSVGGAGFLRAGESVSYFESKNDGCDRFRVKRRGWGMRICCLILRCEANRKRSDHLHVEAARVSYGYR